MEGSVYLKARQEWDERYADLVLGKRNWQITAAGMMAITLVLAFGMVWVSTRSKFVPYVVEVDKLGYAIGAPSALTENTTRISTDRMVRYELAAFIRNAREVITDPDQVKLQSLAGESPVAHPEAVAFAMLGDGDQVGELFSLLNPINHASTRAGIHRYKVEPYVVCADLYSTPPHVGRGGWTWYTGSAGWMYRAGIEWILGFRLRGKTLLIDPCIPRKWPGFEIVYRYGATRYEIAVENPRGASRGVTGVEVDGKALEQRPAQIALADDGATHRVRIILG